MIKLYITTIDCTGPCNLADIFSLESFCSLKSGRGVHFFLGFKCRYPPPRDQFYEWSILVTLNYPLKVKFHLAGTLPQSCRISSSLHRPIPPTMTDPHLTITHHLGQKLLSSAPLLCRGGSRGAEKAVTCSSSDELRRSRAQIWVLIRELDPICCN